LRYHFVKRVMSPILTRRCFLSSIALTALARAQEQDATFSTGVDVVNILANIRNRRGELVKDLTKDDFSLLENGRPQTIRYFTRESDLPLVIGLLIDTSYSQLRVLDAERGGAMRFFDQVLRENKDHVFIEQFDTYIRPRAALTGSRAKLNDALAFVDTQTMKELRSVGGETLLYDAVVQASEEVMKPLTGRKALIVLTDGDDNGSDKTLSEAIDSAHRGGAMVYSILYADSSAGGRDGRPILKRLSQETGGGYFEVSKKLPIDQVFAIIEEDLRNQYSIGYVSDKPPAFAEFRKIQLTVKRQGVTVQARDRYWAVPAN
jgi:VWFA-related protein